MNENDDCILLFDYRAIAIGQQFLSTRKLSMKSRNDFVCTQFLYVAIIISNKPIRLHWIRSVDSPESNSYGMNVKFRIFDIIFVLYFFFFLNQWIIHGWVASKYRLSNGVASNWLASGKL